MSNWFYYDNAGKKCGPIDAATLKTLAEHGIITTETLIENHTGKQSKAGKVKGLTFPAPVPVPPVAVPIPVPLPNDSELPIEMLLGDSPVKKISIQEELDLNEYQREQELFEQQEREQNVREKTTGLKDVNIPENLVNQPSPKQFSVVRFGCGFLFFMFFLSIVAGMLDSDDRTEEQKETFDSLKMPTMARIKMFDTVKLFMKAPDTVEFDDRRPRFTADNETQTYFVRGTGTAKNLFGVPLKFYYEAEVKRMGDSWVVSNVKIE